MEYVKKMRRYCVWSELDHREYTIYDADCKEVYAKLLWGDDPNKMVFTLQSPFGEYVVAITDGILAFVKNNKRRSRTGECREAGVLSDCVLHQDASFRSCPDRRTRFRCR